MTQPEACNSRPSSRRFDPKDIEPAMPVLLTVLSETVGDIGPPAPSVGMALGRAAATTARSAEAVAVLTKALDSRWEYTRREAARALAAFGGRASTAVPRSAPRDGGRASRTLQRGNKDIMKKRKYSRRTLL